jgi:hypothetical protein
VTHRDTTVRTTRRFCWRFSELVFGTIGAVSPGPRVVMRAALEADGVDVHVWDAYGVQPHSRDGDTGRRYGPDARPPAGEAFANDAFAGHRCQLAILLDLADLLSSDSWPTLRSRGR